MPNTVTNAELDMMIEQTQPPEDAPLTGQFSCSVPVARNINDALRELKRLRKVAAKWIGNKRV